MVKILRPQSQVNAQVLQQYPAGAVPFLGPRACPKVLKCTMRPPKMSIPISNTLERY